MGDLKKEIDELKAKLDQAFDKLTVLRKQQELAGYDQQMARPDFWSDQAIAKEISVKQAKLKSEIEPWLNLSRELQELADLDELGDKSLKSELTKTLAKLNRQYDDLEFYLKFSGPHDDQDAILTIQSGAGGTDAQDWVQILQRMYIKWADIHRDIQVELVAETTGDEAGLKHTTLLFSGPYAYGRLRSEHGVHRLVRLSPFNTAHTRETSFAMVEVVPKLDQPDIVQIDDKDLKIDVFRSGGRGGQSVNTTDSAVRITHLPTGLVVSIQNERSQLQNKETALSILRAKLAHLKQEQHAEKVADLKGPNVEAAWGNQIRNYVLHPYQLVKDTRTDYQTSNVEAVMDGKIDDFIESYLTSKQ